jgi:hypothetical protein
VEEVRAALAQLGPESFNETQISKTEGPLSEIVTSSVREQSSALDYLAQLRESQDNVLKATTFTRPPRPARSVLPQPAFQGEQWQRIPLADGIELQLRQPADPATEERVRQLLALAKKLFSST